MATRKTKSRAKSKARTKSPSRSHSRIKAKSKAKSKSPARAKYPAPRKRPVKRITKRVVKRTIKRPAPRKRSPLSKLKPGIRYTKRTALAIRRLKTAREQRGQLAYLREGLKAVRKIYGGFEEKNGFSLRYVSRLPAKRMDELKTYIGIVNRYQARRDEYLIVRKPRSKAKLDALVRRTTQGPGTRKHPRKAFYVETGTPRATELRYTEAPVQKGWRKVALWGSGVMVLEPIVEEGLRAEVVIPFKGGYTVFRDYLFAEILGWQPGLELQKGIEGAKFLGLPQDPWRQMRFAMQQLQPLLPRQTREGKDAYYLVLNSDFGPIGSPSSADDLLLLMNDWYERYEPQDARRRELDPNASTFAETIIGVRYVGDYWKAASGSNKNNIGEQMERRKARYRKIAKQVALDRKRARIKPERSSRLTGRRGRVK